MATIALGNCATPSRPGTGFAPVRALRRFFLLFSGASLAAAEVESLSRLSDAALAERGLSRDTIAHHAMRHLEA